MKIGTCIHSWYENYHATEGKGHVAILRVRGYILPM